MTREEKRKEHYNLTHKIINSIIYKQCPKCKQWLLEDTNNFYMMNKSKPEKGLVARCKKCSSQDRMDFRYQDEEHYERVRRNRFRGY